MTYTLIGTGNMAWLIASRMLGGGHTCTGVWGRNAVAVDELCAAFTLPRLHSFSQVHDGPDACIVAITDSEIAAAVSPLAFRCTTLIHTAGSVAIDGVAARSIHAGVVWPVYSIRKNALPVHRSFPAVVEANTDMALNVARTVAKAICDTTYEATGAQRRWLHLAAVMGNNFVNHLLGIATDICVEQGLPVSLLQPLLEQSIAGARTQHSARLQTGPARRHDMLTMDGHLSMLRQHPEWLTLYKMLSEAIMERYPIAAKD